MTGRGSGNGFSLLQFLVVDRVSYSRWPTSLLDGCAPNISFPNSRQACESAVAWPAVMVEKGDKISLSFSRSYRQVVREVSISKIGDIIGGRNSEPTDASTI